MYGQRAVLGVVLLLVGCGDDTVIPSLPVADAGFDQTVTPGTEVRFDGSASYDPGAGDLDYVWTMLTRPTGSTVDLVGETTEAAKLTPDEVGQYVVSLTVSNGKRESVPDRVNVTVRTQQTPLTADAACPVSCDVTHGTNGSVRASNTYGGTGSYTFSWDQITDATECATRCPEIAGCAPLPNDVFWQADNVEVGSFLAPCQLGSMVFEVTVSDGASTDTDCVEMTTINTPPAAKIGWNGLSGSPPSIDDTLTFTLLGSNSEDADTACDTVQSYQWAQLSPVSPLAIFQNDTNAITDVTLPNVTGTTTFQFGLVVSDGIDSSEDPCTDIRAAEGFCGAEVIVFDAN